MTKVYWTVAIIIFPILFFHAGFNTGVEYERDRVARVAIRATTQPTTQNYSGR